MIIDQFSKGVTGELGFLLVMGAIAIPILGCGIGLLFFIVSEYMSDCGCKTNHYNE